MTNFRATFESQTCRNCGALNLYWKRVRGAWCLIDSSGYPHVCNLVMQGTPEEQLAKLPVCGQCMVHRLLYYVHSRPILSDYDYDMLERQATQELELLSMDDHPMLRPGSDLENSYPAPLQKLARALLGG